MMTAIGWVIGGPTPGLLVDYIGPTGLFTLTGLLGGVSLAIQYAYFPREALVMRKANLRELYQAIRSTWDLALATVLAIAALNMFYNMIALRVYSEIHNLIIYGVALSASTALASAVVRPYAGKLVDKYNPVKIVIASLLAYILLNTGLYLSSGILLLILYAVPIYPFRDTATVIAISRKIPVELQSTAAGINTAMTSLAGFIVLLLTGTIGKDLARAYTLHLVLITSSIAILTYRNLKKHLEVLDSPLLRRQVNSQY